jgi:hypothetical protein
MPLTVASQATSIEQARAIAEVLAAIEAAQRVPRDEVQAMERMRKACASRALAEKAFYAVARGDGTASGESIHLARELARCWSHLNYGTKELSRNDERGVSEIQAYAIDLESLVRVESTFIVPHRKSLKGGQWKPIVDLGQIYENNANNGARRVRECIMNVLPYGFVAEAARLCNETLSKMDVGELNARVEKVVAAFERGGIDKAQLEAKVGMPFGAWSAQELVELEVLLASLKRKEITRDEAFPAATVTSETIKALAQPAPEAPDALAHASDIAASAVIAPTDDEKDGDAGAGWPQVPKIPGAKS